jgi:hypothetical protein
VGLARGDGGGGWRCHACGAGGDGPDWTAYVVAGHRLRDLTADERGRVRAWYSDAPADVPRLRVAPRVDPVADEAEYPPPAGELAELWAGARDVCDDPDVYRYCRSRGWDPAAIDRRGLARALPADAAGAWTWWPAWMRHHRLAVPAVDAGGRVRSVHARAIVADVRAKAAWPSGCTAGGLLLACDLGRALLARPAVHGQRVLVVEGLTDLLAAALALRGEWAVLGVGAGAGRAVAGVRWPPAARVVVVTDADDVGDRYAAQVAAAVPPRVDLRRARIDPHPARRQEAG